MSSSATVVGDVSRTVAAKTKTKELEVNTKGETVAGHHLPSKTVLTTVTTTEVKKNGNSNQTATTIVTHLGADNKT